jgi:hypothetical protein
MKQAQEEYRQTMARLGNGPTDSRSGTVSASGTSAARSDRN